MRGEVHSRRRASASRSLFPMGHGVSRLCEGNSPPPDLVRSGTYMGRTTKIFYSKELIAKIFGSNNLALRFLNRSNTPGD